MKISYLIIAAAIVLIAGISAYLLFFRANNGALQNQAGPYNTRTALSPLDPSVIPSGEKITLGAARGSVGVNNFYKTAAGFDGDALVIKNAPDYQIIYNPADSAFGIFIIAGDMQAARHAAENDLLSILGISKEQACILAASWGVSANVDSGLAGKNYPLSFCPNKVQ